MIDRESTFADPEIIELLKQRFVPVAIDQAYQRRQQDTEGEFYRKIAGQGPRNDFDGTTQGFYIATADGDLLLYNNNRDVPKVRRLMRDKLRQFQATAPGKENVREIRSETSDRRYNPRPPEGGLVVRVRAKVLGGYEPTTSRHREIFQSAMSRDNLWVTAEEHRALREGDFAESLMRRIARFHLVDNTRGEPPMWREGEIRRLEMTVRDGRIRGEAHLETDRGDRGYRAQLFGEIETRDDRIVRLDLVALGDFWGEGRFTRNAPEGRFPLAVALTLADGSEVADDVPPQGSRGWVDGYLR